MSNPERSSVQALIHRAAVSYRVRSTRLGARLAGLNELLASRPEGSIPWTPTEMYPLFRNIRTRKPKIAMEFGVGSTTSVILEALRRNGEGHLITVDSNKQWLTATEDAMPAQLRERVTFVHSALKQVQYEGVDCHVYTDIPNEPLDFLYVDGPDPADVPGWGQKSPMSLDPIEMESRFRTGFRMVVEGRVLNSAFLQKQLKRKYNVKDDKRFRVTTFDLIS